MHGFRDLESENFRVRTCNINFKNLFLFLIYFTVQNWRNATKSITTPKSIYNYDYNNNKNNDKRGRERERLSLM